MQYWQNSNDFFAGEYYEDNRSGMGRMVYGDGEVFQGLFENNDFIMIKNEFTKKYKMSVQEHEEFVDQKKTSNQFSIY
eukprot:CAMPEP_0116935158 /NCGR_PEP_ID=MMETSP0467-20121206/30096_1 /TAXON_ID=283647 /ORGANISM="Mesodinium pulex, Strain SPMC105" /LENGTH=77 /DNA_ID=CAMNT_0004616437 /DNA_START=1107 /DNA_END=1340 /DNA_ORIENTATION=-